MSARDARTLKRGLVALLVIVTLGKGFPALRRHEASARASTAEAAQELSALRAAARGHGTMRDSLLVRRRRLELLRSALMHAETPQLAAAELAESLGEYAAAAGARVNAMAVRSDTAFSRGVARVVVRMSIATDIQGIAELINAIEVDPRLVAVRELSVSGNEPGAATTRMETLASELVVEGLALEIVRDSARRRGTQ